MQYNIHVGGKTYKFSGLKTKWNKAMHWKLLTHSFTNEEEKPHLNKSEIVLF